MPVRKNKNWLSSKIIALVSFIILIFFGVNLTREFLAGEQLDENVDSLKDEMSGLESKNKELNDLIGYLNTTDFIEQEARSKLNLQKPGERIIIVPSSTEAALPVTLTDNSVESVKTDEKSVDASIVVGSNPNRWLKYFFKN